MGHVPGITGFSHVGVRVRDLDAARHFYELLGFEFVVGPIGPEPVAILRHPAGVEINLVLNATVAQSENVLMDVDVKHTGYTHLALECADVDAAVTALEAAGITITEGPVDFPHGARSIFMRDPDLNVVELAQPASPEQG